MKINLSNYESFLLDYIENKLTSTEKAEVEDFLLQNPSILGAYESSNLPKFTPENITYNNKENLYKLEFEKTPVTTANFPDFCIAWYEKILSEDKKKELSSFLKSHPTLEQEFMLFEKAFLKSDTTIHYPYKKSLYKKNGKKTSISLKPYFIWPTAAASILFIVYMGFNYTTNQVTEIKRSSGDILNVISLNKNTSSQSKTENPQRIAYSKENISLHNQKEIHKTKPEEKTDRETGIQTITTLACNKVIIDKKDSISYTNVNLAENNYKEAENYDISTYENETPEEETSISKEILAYAENKISRFNKIVSNQNLAFSRKISEDGKTSSLSIKAGFFEFSRSKTH